jgi:glycine dehydrogenase
MIEPTESESKDELDRFCDALLSIKGEIDLIAKGEMDTDQNVLTNAPHTLVELSSDEWVHSYTREQAAYPLEYLKHGHKFWATVGRVDSAHGDRNLVCVCAPIEDYMED